MPWKQPGSSKAAKSALTIEAIARVAIQGRWLLPDLRTHTVADCGPRSPFRCGQGVILIQGSPLEVPLSYAAPSWSWEPCFRRLRQLRQALVDTSRYLNRRPTWLVADLPDDHLGAPIRAFCGPGPDPAALVAVALGEAAEREIRALLKAHATGPGEWVLAHTDLDFQAHVAPGTMRAGILSLSGSPNSRETIDHEEP